MVLKSKIDTEVIDNLVASDVRNLVYKRQRYTVCVVC